MEKLPPRVPPPQLDATHGCIFKKYILEELIIVSWVIFLWELYLSLRQRSLIKRLSQRPSVLDNLMSTETYSKSRNYALDRCNFGIIQDVYSNILNTIFIIYWGFYFSWEWGRSLVDAFGLDRQNEIVITAGCITVMRIYSMILCDLPFTVYDTFVLEQKFNFNKQTPLFFIKDQIVKFIVSQVLIVPLMCSMVWIVKNGGDYFFIYLWVFTVSMSLLMMIIYPEIIAPLFDKYSPLPEGNLKVRIEELASRLGFPLYKLYIVEGSRRSSHSNAYLYGFYKYKRIVLFDTLIAEYQQKKADEEKIKKAEKAENEDQKEVNEESKQEEKETEKEVRGCETDEIIAVLAHELGHWHHSHALQGFLYGQVIFLSNFILFAQMLHYSPIYEAFGFTDSQPVLIGLTIVMMYILAPLNKLLSWILTSVSRKFEFQADKYAQRLGHAAALKTALVKLHKDNLGYPLFDKLYSNWHHSHPPMLERLDALNKDD